MPKHSKTDRIRDRETIRWIFTYSSGQRLRILFLTFSNAIGAVLSVAFALSSRGIIDSAVNGTRDALIRYGVLLLMLVLGQILLSLMARSVSEYVAARLQINFQNRLLRILFEKDYSSLAGYHSGELMNRLLTDVTTVTSGMVNICPSLAYLVFQLVGASAVLLALAPQFTLLFLVAGVLMFLVMTLLRDRLKRLYKSMREEEGKARSFIQEALERLLVIKTFDAGDAVCSKAEQFQESYFVARMKRRFVSVLTNAGFNFIFGIGEFLALAWGSVGIFLGNMTYGTLMAMLQLVSQIQSPFSGFSGLISQVYTVLASAERLMELEQLPEEPQVQQQTECAEYSYDAFREIRLSHVDFTYGRNMVLKDVNIQIEKGDFVSLTGLSGGGKSTLFLLLLGAYQATKGEVTFAYETVSAHPGAATRHLFAYVPQGNYLLSGTLRENLTFFRSDIPDERIWRALELACAEPFVKELPEGLDTVLGEKGQGLSEGQMQRIAIARALLSEAPILMLDESTSALDEDTEAQLLKNIASLKEKTCLIVTHRKAALAICNRHLVLKNGRLAYTKETADLTVD